jgi:hypothetical protein
MIEIIRQEASLHNSLSVAQMCAVLRIARADYYRQPWLDSEGEADLQLRDSMMAHCA